MRKTCAGHDVHPFKRSSRTLAHHVCLLRQSRRRGGIISFPSSTIMEYYCIISAIARQPNAKRFCRDDPVDLEGFVHTISRFPLDYPRLCSFTKIVLTSEYDSRVRLSGPNSRMLSVLRHLWANPRQAPLELNWLLRKVRRGKGDYPPGKSMLPQRLYSKTEL